MTTNDSWPLAVAVLRGASAVVDGVQAGLATRGFDDVRPAHGFAFARIAAGDAAVLDVAEHLGVTKQAASQLVEQLVQRGYVTREDDPRDGRARILRLTERGHACTRAAAEAAADVVDGWRRQLGPEATATLARDLQAAVGAGRLRPAW